MHMEGARCLVVGGARRLGGALAVALAGYGSDVAVSTRAPASAAEVAGAIGALGRRCVVVSGDVTSRVDARHIVAAATLGLGGLDVLVFAASGPFTSLPADAVGEDDWGRSMDVIARGFLFAAQAARDQFLGGVGTTTAAAAASTSARETTVDGGSSTPERGVIVAITDILDSRPWGSMVPHFAAKAAQHMLIKTLAAAWAAEGVRVCGVAPGPVHLPGDEHREATERAAARFGLLRLVGPAEVASVVRLCVENAALTGVDLPVDAGASLA
jgi:2-deoxy-D-gluconate 3-dehydrogenase